MDRHTFLESQSWLSSFRSPTLGKGDSVSQPKKRPRLIQFHGFASLHVSCEEQYNSGAQPRGASAVDGVHLGFSTVKEQVDPCQFQLLVQIVRDEEADSPIISLRLDNVYYALDTKQVRQVVVTADIFATLPVELQQTCTAAARLTDRPPYVSFFFQHVCLNWYPATKNDESLTTAALKEVTVEVLQLLMQQVSGRTSTISSTCCPVDSVHAAEQAVHSSWKHCLQGLRTVTTLVDCMTSSGGAVPQLLNTLGLLTATLHSQAQLAATCSPHIHQARNAAAQQLQECVTRLCGQHASREQREAAAASAARMHQQLAAVEETALMVQLLTCQLAPSCIQMAPAPGPKGLLRLQTSDSDPPVHPGPYPPVV